MAGLTNMMSITNMPFYVKDAGVAGILSKEITAFFQPIIAADTNKIYGYEVLGRYFDNGNIRSLGPFYSSATNEEALTVDRIVRRNALKRFADEGSGEYLFINMRLNWMTLYADNPREMPTIKWAEEFGIDPGKIVIEITEEDFLDVNESVAKSLVYYRSAGCRIAIDDFGRAASHVDRLALLAPDILKIDKSYIHRSVDSLYYREYLSALTSFAERVGIEALYEGIETEEQLDICAASRGRLYQGFLIANPQPFIRNATANQRILRESIDRRVKSLRENSIDGNNRHGLWDARVERFLYKHGNEFSTAEMDDYLSKIGFWLAALIKRAYLCDGSGKQLSYNIEVDSGNIERRDYRNRNWAWRGFFQEAMTALDKGEKSYMTDMYRDVTTKENIQTYIYCIRPDIYLFVDIARTS